MSQAMDLARAGQGARAVDVLRRAAQRWPRHAELNSALSALLAQTGQADQAVYHAERAVEISPRDAFLRTNLAGLLLTSGKPERALAAFEAAVAADPRFAPAHSGRASCLHIRGELGAALEAARRSVELDPRSPQASVVLARLLGECGLADEAVSVFRRVLPVIQGPPRVVVLAEYAQMLLYAEGVSAEDVRGAHAEFARELVTPLGVAGALATRRPNVPQSDLPEARPAPRRIRIGYVSGDFRTHSVASFVEPLLASHDREAFSVTCFQASAPAGDDAVTARLKALGHAWVPAHDADGPKLADLIRREKIDVLVELSGLTPGQRLRALALRPAPVQLSYLGYPHATGLNAIDYRLSDAAADPVGADSASGSGSDPDPVLRLDPCFLCYHPPAVDQVVASAREPRSFTFASFNNITKVTPGVLDAWAAILRETPGSRLLLKSFRLSDPLVRADLAARLASRGIDPARVEVAPRTATVSEHLALYLRTDVALDTFPYNGTTTTFEALFMGRPVITLRGDSHRARVGASVLAALGETELIAAGREEYVRAAVRLAGDAPRCAAYHTALRERLLGSPLCDAGAFARKVEDLYRSLWWALVGV